MGSQRVGHDWAMNTYTHTHRVIISLPGGLCCVKDLKCIFATNSSKSDGLTELGETETRYTMG